MAATCTVIHDTPAAASKRGHPTRTDSTTDWAKVRRISHVSSWTTAGADVSAAKHFHPGGVKHVSATSGWTSALDPATGSLFFTDTTTGESSWTPPPGHEFRVADDGLAYTRCERLRLSCLL